MVRQLPKGGNRVISIRREREDKGPYVCVNCCGVEDVSNIHNKDQLWKHLEDFHGWPSKNDELLSVIE
jgi:hypothetical protein